MRLWGGYIILSSILFYSILLYYIILYYIIIYYNIIILYIYIYIYMCTYIYIYVSYIYIYQYNKEPPKLCKGPEESSWSRAVGLMPPFHHTASECISRHSPEYQGREAQQKSFPVKAPCSGLCPLREVIFRDQLLGLPTTEGTEKAQLTVGDRH